jgi:hypothetical protein
MARNKPLPQRVVYAPLPTGPGAQNHIVSVVLNPGERVEWEWTPLPMGGAFVSGYRIRWAWRRREERPRPES